MTYRKKLIEVALPLDAINRESAREKSIRHGHPSTMHLWWARRPLAACRAVLFASLVDDPGNDLPEEGAAKERERLFQIIEELVKWENTNNEVVLKAARDEILKSTKGNPPPVLDPFCGGGSIPLEAQRLGLEAYASDLNPVAVLITKALIEIPQKFAGKPPVNPDSKKGTASTAAWKGASGLAADVRYYGKWMCDEAWKRIGHLYPKGPNGETIIAWLWTRTVKCPNPACGAQMPLVRSFWLSTKRGKEVWIQPIVDNETRTVEFKMRTGKGSPPEGTIGDRQGYCLICGQPFHQSQMRAQALKYGFGAIPLGAIAESAGQRTYLSYNMESLAKVANVPEVEAPFGEITKASQYMTPPLYGLTKFSDLFNPRQLVAMTSFCELVQKAQEVVLADSDNGLDYANAIATYLAFGVSRLANYSSSLNFIAQDGGFIVQVFGRQALPMIWDYAEVNPFSGSTGNWLGAIEWIAKSLGVVPYNPPVGYAWQYDSAAFLPSVPSPMICTDPPYYNNVPYADLSDYFYIWLRRSIGAIYPDLFSTLLTPKQTELVATPYHFEGDQNKAKEHFETGLGRAFRLMRATITAQYPTTVFYAFKQEESVRVNDVGSMRITTGWETMLKALIGVGFQITATWPMRTERSGGFRHWGRNALASSILLTCRNRPEDAPIATRREFLSTLRKELPSELRTLMNGQVAPVDLAQATIGPGMAVFSRYSKVIEADGSAMTVRTALQEINYFLEDYLAQQEGDLDVESQFCVTWFQQYGSKEGPFGEADVLSRAKNISVDGLTRLSLVDAARGKVRLTLREDYEDGWDPGTESRLTAWEACQRLVWNLSENGEQETGRLARRLGGKAEEARQLAYRLYGIADRKGWADEALGYNALVASWPEIQKAAAAAAEETQGRMV